MKHFVMKHFVASMLSTAVLLLTGCATANPASPSDAPTPVPIPATLAVPTATPGEPIKAYATPASAQTPPAARASATTLAAATPEPLSRPNPLTVRIMADPGLSVSGVITTAGGSLSAKASDGTRFTLALPAGALAEPAEITLTPVSAVDGLPFSGGHVAAVQMAPEGLTFLKALTLTIEPAGAVSRDGFETVGFAARDDGHEFHLHPSDVREARITIRLTHFSDYGAVRATPAEIKRQKEERPPTSLRDRHDQEQVGERRNASWQRTFDAQWFAELKPRLEDASRNETILRQVLNEFLEWESALSDRNAFAGDIELGWRLLAKGILNAIARSSENCVANRDPSQIMAMAYWILIATLPPESYISKEALAAAENKMQNCATFELRFDSQLDMTFESSAVYAKLRTHARAKVAVRLNVVGYERPDDEMTAPLEYALYAAEIKPAVKGVSCKPTGAQPEPGTHKLVVLHPYLNWTPARNKLMPATIAVALSMTPMPGGKLEEVTVCSSAIGKDVLTLFHNWFFPGGFRDMHKDEMTGSGLLITDWQRGDATVFMRKTYDRSGTCVTLKCVEKTMLELIHKPR